MDGGFDEPKWAEARKGLSVGQRLRGVVIEVPQPLGVIGVFVDIGLPVAGLVHLPWLPWDTGRWPTEGTVTDFEIVQLDDRPQVWLRPLDWRYQREDQPVGWHWRSLREDQPEWEHAKARWPVGAVVTGTVVGYNGDQSYYIDLGRFCGFVSLRNTVVRLEVGSSGTFRVIGHFDMLRHIDLVPITDRDPDDVHESATTD